MPSFQPKQATSQQLQSMNPKTFFAGTDVHVGNVHHFEPTSALRALLEVHDVSMPLHADGTLEAPYALHPGFRRSIERLIAYADLSDRSEWQDSMASQLMYFGYHADFAAHTVDLRWRPRISIQTSNTSSAITAHLHSAPGQLRLLHPNGTARFHIDADRHYLFLSVPPGQSRIWLNGEALPFATRVPVVPGDQLRLDSDFLTLLSVDHIPPLPSAASPTGGTSFWLDETKPFGSGSARPTSGLGHFPEMPDLVFSQTPNSRRLFITDTRSPDDVLRPERLELQDVILNVNFQQSPLQHNGTYIPVGQRTELFEGDLLLHFTSSLRVRFPEPTVPVWLKRSVTAHTQLGNMLEAQAALNTHPGTQHLARVLGRTLRGTSNPAALPLYWHLREGAVRYMQSYVQDPNPDIDLHNESTLRELSQQYLKAQHRLEATQHITNATSLSELQRIVQDHPFFEHDTASKTAIALVKLGTLDAIEKISHSAGLRQRVRDLLDTRAAAVQAAHATQPPLNHDAATFVDQLSHTEMQFIEQHLSGNDARVIAVREALYQVLHRGKEIERIPRSFRKGITAMQLRKSVLQQLIEPTIDAAEQLFPDAMRQRRNQLSGEYLPRDNRVARYRHARMLLNQQAGRPVFGSPTRREQTTLLGVMHTLDNTLLDYDAAQQRVRQLVLSPAPEDQQRLEHVLREATPEQRGLIVEAFFGNQRHRDMPDIETAISAAILFGLSGIHREVGVALRPEGRTMIPVLSLGNMISVGSEHADWITVLHTHPELYRNEWGRIVGERHDGKVDHAATMLDAIVVDRLERQTHNILFSRQDVLISLRRARQYEHRNFPNSAVYSRELQQFYNWVQHPFGGSEITVQLDGNTITKVTVRYALNEHRTALGTEYRGQRDKLQTMLKKPALWAKENNGHIPTVTFERLPTHAAFLERLPIAQHAYAPLERAQHSRYHSAEDVRVFLDE